MYTLGNSEGTTVSNNVIHHIYSRDYGGWGLYTDEGTQNILMENNLVYACKSAGFHQHYGKNNIIRNNIFAFIKISAIQVSRVEEHLSYTFTNNIIYQEDGEIISDVWEGDNGTKIIVDYDRNCYWKVGEPSPKSVSYTHLDNASGSRENPLATITEARDRIRELRKQQLLTDTIHVKVFPGTYLLTEAITFTSEDSGTEQSPTVYTSATGERPLFLGGIETGSFEVESPTLWKVFIPETRLGFSFEQVYINGERRFRAQTPNRGSFFQVGKMEKVFQIGSGERTNFSVHKFAPEAKDASFLTDFEPGEEERAVVTFYHKWETVTKPIEYIDHTDTTFFVSGKNMYHASGNSKYFVSNYRKALDEPGEWFLDQEGWLYYIPVSYTHLT